MKELKNFNGCESSPRIFISPLDWGLGHATRCIPIIKTLLAQGCTIFIGSDKDTYILLKKEFPQVHFIRMKGYQIKYSRKIGGFYLKILSQMPRIITVIFNENRLLKNIIRKYKIDAVISDNRFGLHSKLVPCIYITHQLNIKTGNILSDKIATALHRRIMRKFTTTWIPDFQCDGLGGELSHPKKLPVNSVYLGALSRFEKLPLTKKMYDILIALSGPEPQRTLFEENILKQCGELRSKILLLRGLPGTAAELIHDYTHLKAVNHLSAKELNLALAQSAFVISRSGYTTVMDLAKLQKKAILIPTPGQTEQEYLARYLLEKRYFLSMPQTNFVLKKALQEAAEFETEHMPPQEEKYAAVISEFVTSLKMGKFAIQ